MRFACIILALACYLTPVSPRKRPTGHRRKGTQDLRKSSEIPARTQQGIGSRRFQESRQAGWWHCLDCQIKMIKYGVELGEWKTAELAAEEM